MFLLDWINWILQTLGLSNKQARIVVLGDNPFERLLLQQSNSKEQRNCGLQPSSLPVIFRPQSALLRNGGEEENGNFYGIRMPSFPVLFILSTAILPQYCHIMLFP